MTFLYIVRQKPSYCVILLAFGTLAFPLTGNGCTSLCNFLYILRQKLSYCVVLLAFGTLALSGSHYSESQAH